MKSRELEELGQFSQCLISQDNYYKSNFKSLDICLNDRNCIEKIEFQGDLKIKQVSQYGITARQENGENIMNKDQIRFQSGVVTENRNIAMCRN